MNITNGKSDELLYSFNSLTNLANGEKSGDRSVIGQDFDGTLNGLSFWMKKEDIQFFGTFMKVVLHIKAEPQSQSSEWKIALNNERGGKNEKLASY